MTKREITSARTNEQHLIAYGVAIFVCVFLGPFDTDVDLDFENRLAFWTVAVIAVGTVMQACFIAVLASRWLARLHIVALLAIGALVGAVPGTAIVVFINKVFRPEHLTETSFLVMWLQVSVMGMLVAGLECLIWYPLQSGARAAQPISDVLRGTQTEDTAEADAKPADRTEPEEPQALSLSRLARRLPDRLRHAQIISLSMQDHYVEVTTTKGSDMLLMRLSDAIDLLDGLAGVQTHRSHWAARAHARRLEKVNRRHELILSDDRRIPVSKSFHAAVEQMLNEKSRPEPALI